MPQIRSIERFWNEGEWLLVSVGSLLKLTNDSAVNKNRNPSMSYGSNYLFGHLGRTHDRLVSGRPKQMQTSCLHHCRLAVLTSVIRSVCQTREEAVRCHHERRLQCCSGQV